MIQHKARMKRNEKSRGGKKGRRKSSEETIPENNYTVINIG
jgi:hypothetical protein